MQFVIVNAQYCIASCGFSANIHFIVTLSDRIHLDLIHPDVDARRKTEMDFMGFIA